jgi:hypothetical protein
MILITAKAIPSPRYGELICVVPRRVVYHIAVRLGKAIPITKSSVPKARQSSP